MGGLLSRRAVFGLGGAAFAASWPGGALGADKPEITNIQGASDQAQRMTIQGTIGGRGPFRFVVDTGADRSVLADDVARALNLPVNPDVLVQGIARSVPAPTVVAGNLEFGTVAIDSLAMPILPRAWLGVDGFFGLDAIDGRRVQFDFQKQSLTVGTSQNFVVAGTGLVAPSELVVRADGSHGRLKAVDCFVDGVHAFAFLDSGSEATIGNGHLAAELQKRGATFDGVAPIQLTGVTGGFVMGRPMTMDMIRLGPLDFKQGRLIVADLPVFDVWGLADRPALFIGMDFLRTTRSVTIDYGRRAYLFKLADIRIARA